MDRSADVLIVGGGVIGSAIAYFLAADASFTGGVLVVEPDPTYERASTARSVGGVRQQFSTPENIRMSVFGAQFVRNAHELLAVDGEQPDVSFREGGYLFLATAAGMAVLEENHAVQRTHGAHNALLSAAELEARFPWMCADGIAGGCLGLSEEGWLDPYALLQAFKRKARALGVRYLEDRVCGMQAHAARVQRVDLSSGGALHPGIVVNAAGPRAREVAAMAGIELPVFPRRRQVFAVECRQALPGCPLVIDPSGAYFRPEGALFLCGRAPQANADPDTLSLEVDHAQFEDVLWPLLAARVPAFEAVKVRNAWAGHYAVNTLDANAVLGPHPEITNVYLANGFSGHGLQQSPAVGRGIAEHITHGAYRSLDLGRFGFERIVRNEPVLERNVV